MNGRALAIGSGLLVVATSTAIIGSASAAADGASHRARTATSSRTSSRSLSPGTSPVDVPSVDPAVTAQNTRVVTARLVEVMNAQRWYDAAAATAVQPQPAPAPRTSSGYSGDILECIKHRESDGQYDVVNSSSGAAGAYQFMPGTWDTNAESGGRPDLVGVNPADASPADQDAMAQHLLATQGMGPWGGRCG